MPLLLALVLLLLPYPAAALPTPDVLVASAAGAAQLVAAVSLSFGGLLWRFRRYLPSRRVLGWLAVVAVGALLLSAAGLFARLDKAQSSEARDYPLMDQDSAEEAIDPHGIGTAEAEQLLRDPTHGGRLILDVRERPELIQGGIPGFTPMRLPDMEAAGIGEGSHVLVSCWTGMRGSEVCNKLAAQGTDCLFIRDGISKWSKEHRLISIPPGVDPDYLGTSGEHRNYGVELGADDAAAAMKNGGALIDPRPAALWRRGHYPGSVNLSFTELPLPELDAALAALPKGPLVTVCSGEISCALADDLGAEIAAAGGDFRGIFSTKASALTAVSLPFFGSVAEDVARAAIATGLPAWLLVVLLAILARAAVQPLIRGLAANGQATTAAKQAMAEGGQSLDEMAARRHLAALSERHGFRLSRAAGGLILVPLMGVGTALAAALAKAGHGGLWWVADIGQRDHTMVFPAMAASALAATLWWSSKSDRNNRLVMLVTVLPAAAWMCSRLSAGSNLYLAITTMPLSLGMAVDTFRAFRLRSALAQAAKRGVIPLKEAALVIADQGKAGRLAHLARDGFPVPTGFVVLRPDADPAAMMALASRLGTCAVRSSAPAEDGAVTSHAGMFETMLGVAPQDVPRAVAAVFQAQSGQGEVLVQRMVDGDLFGVMFTRHPDAGGRMLIEAAQSADAVTGGDGATLSVEVPRPLPQSLDGQGALVDPLVLAHLGLRIEERYGAAQDVEWALEGSRLALLQARDVTRLLGSPEDEVDPRRVAEAETDRVSRLLETGHGPFAQDDAAGLLPCPTLMSADLLNRLWGHGGSVDIACRALGVQYDWRAGDRPAYAVLFGRLYRAGDGPGLKLPSRAATVRRLIIDAEAAWSAFLPGFRQRMELLEAVDVTRLTNGALKRMLSDVLTQFSGPDHAAAEMVNLAAVVACADGGDGAPESLEARLWRSLPDGDPARREARFRRLFSWRAPCDYELSCPRYGEPGSEPLTLPEEVAGTAAGMMNTQGHLLELREDSRHEVFRELALLRRLVLEMGRRLKIADVFHLTFDELMMAAQPSDQVARRRRAARRRRVADILRRAGAGPVLDAATLHGGRTQDGADGVWLSGAGPFAGTALVLRDGEVPADISAGSVVVGRALSPRQVAHCAGVAGIVVAVGSRLSHAAIQARELAVPMLVWMRLPPIESGDRVSVDVAGQVSVDAQLR